MKTFEKLTEGHVEAAASDNGGPKDWLIRFKRRVEAEGPTTIVHSLAQMGVATPVNCDCTVSNPESDPEGAEFHGGHVRFNRAVHEILSAQPRLIQRIRRVLREDLKKTSHIEPGYGQIVRKEYAKELLDKFLVKNPDPTWIGTTTE